MHAGIDISAPAERVFALWADPASWPRWDPDLERASLDGPFAAGSVGEIKARGAPATRIELTSVVAARSFTALARLPLCRLRFEHTLTPDGRGCRATHAVRFEGPLGGLFAVLIGRRIERALPDTMAGLKAAAEAPPEARDAR